MIQNSTKRGGFTIVELLIVIVVIAILAAISVVAYSGVQQRAEASARQAAVGMLEKKLSEYNILHEKYPESISDCPVPTANNLCLTGAVQSDVLYEPLAVNSFGSSTGVVTPGYSLGVVGKTNFAFQVTKEQSGVNEFNRYIDIAPYIDRFGLGTYILSFDLRSKDTSVSDRVQVYLQNGSNTRYYFSIGVSATTDYKRYTLEVNPSGPNPGISQAYLAFYGNYNTGNVPVVKNVVLRKK